MGMRRIIWGTAAALSAIGVAVAVMYRPAFLTSPLKLVAEFEPGVPGRSEPLLTSGITDAGDFLYVRFLDSDTAVFCYDSWGAGGPTSRPVKLRPGLPHPLEIDGPMLTPPDESTTADSHLRVVCDGEVVLNANVSHHLRTLDQLYLGANPIGGTSCGQAFHGSLTSEDGRPFYRRLDPGASRIARQFDWWTYSLPRILLLPLILAVIILACEKLVGLSRAGGPSVAARALRGIRAHLWFAIPAAVAAGIFSYFVTGGDFDFDYWDSFGSFYDYQAASLLRGRLDVPFQAVGDEAFVYQGRAYGYFGPTPALMRIPFAVCNLAFGRLSRAFMLLDYLGCIVFAYLILRLAVKMIRAEDASPSGWSVVLMITNAGLGSTLLFVGSQAYVYHEAILAGAAFALACCYFTLRLLKAPEGRSWVPALVCGVLAIQARPSPGLFALTFLGFAALFLFARTVRMRGSAGRSILIGALACAGVLSFNFVTYLKFGSFESLPLKYNIQFNAKRLARFDGTNFHLSNIGINTNGYVSGANFEFRRSFPYFYALAPRMADHTGAKIDAIENIVAIPFAMAGLSILTVGGSVCALARAPKLRPSLAVTWAAVVPLCVALFTAVAMSHRYTADFCPFLIVASAIALAAFDSAGFGAVLRTALWLLTLWSVFATVALTFENQGEVVWGVPPEAKARFQSLRMSFDRFFDHGSNTTSR